VVGRTPQRLVLAVAAASAVVTVAFILVPQLRFAYDAPKARVALETAIVVVALLASYLMLGRYLAVRRLDSLGLACGLLVLALAQLAAVVMLAVGHGHDWRVLSVGGSMVGALVLALAAAVPGASVPSLEPGRSRVVGAALAVVVIVGGLLALDLSLAPETLPADLDTARLNFESDVPLLVAQLVAIGAFAVAASGFALTAARDDDRFLASVAVGTTLAAFSRVHYLLFAPTSTAYVRSGDAFRALFYAVLLVGAAREIESYWRSLAQSAVLDERRRIARELHDGVAQELAFIGRRSRRLEAEHAREIAAAAERALNDSRRAIAALSQAHDRNLADVLVEALDDVAGRHGVVLDLNLEPGVDVDPEAREALTRIACEAVANAARHGGADTVRVELAGGERVRFSVQDSGSGFDPSRPKPGRFGLSIMRERAEAVGGSFRVASGPGAGTLVEVEL